VTSTATPVLLIQALRLSSLKRCGCEVFSWVELVEFEARTVEMLCVRHAGGRGSGGRVARADGQDPLVAALCTRLIGGHVAVVFRNQKSEASLA
jgi:hypothetical protein